jgi:hypothetical protein
LELDHLAAAPWDSAQRDIFRKRNFVSDREVLATAMAVSPRLKSIIGPNGRPLTLGDLPPVKPTRWFPAHKANVVAAVRGGLLTADQACKRYKLTAEEFSIWLEAFDTHGTMGLKVAHVTRLRKSRYGPQKNKP